MVSLVVTSAAVRQEGLVLNCGLVPHCRLVVDQQSAETAKEVL
jgi:hypothetical protein